MSLIIDEIVLSKALFSFCDECRMTLGSSAKMSVASVYMLRMLNPGILSQRQLISSPGPAFLLDNTKNADYGLVRLKSLRFTDFMLLCRDSELAGVRVLGSTKKNSGLINEV